ncbi:MAG: hypothetical protein WC382_13025 [Methanoregulaceae archaeon]
MQVFAAPPDEQEGLTRQRPDAMCHEIRRILTYMPSPYMPPPTDREEAYRDACSSCFRFGVCTGAAFPAVQVTGSHRHVYPVPGPASRYPWYRIMRKV